MVYFTCSNCGEALKKSKVEKHYLCVCRSRPPLTCVDCLKDFNSQNYESHTKCVTEQERYAAKGFTPKPSSDKAEKKQEEKVRLLAEFVKKENYIDIGVKGILKFLLQIPIPVKKDKFRNIMKNHGSFRNTPEHILEEVWEILEKIELSWASGQKQENVSKDTDGGESIKKGESAKKAKEKVKLDCTEHEESKNDVFCEAGMENNLPATEGILSKKERKEKRKREKYEKELMEIESRADHVDVPGSAEAIIDEKSNRKKRKCMLSNGTDDSGVNGVAQVDNENGEVKSRKKKKKHNKERVENQTSQVHQEDAENKQEVVLDDAVPTEQLDYFECLENKKSNKFNWEETIMSILQSKKELPLKRLQKKVINEYINSGVYIKSMEKAITKFNKKVLKIPSVKVKKDVAKLV